MPIATNPQTGETFYLDERGAWVPAMTAVHPQLKKMVVYDGKDWIAAPLPSRTLGQLADDTVRSMASGATGGLAETIAAAGNEALGQGTYEKNLAAEMQRTAQIPAGIRVPGEIAGGIGATLALAPAAAAAGLARVPGFVSNPTIGALTGGLYGAGGAEPGQRMEGMGKGALIGIGVGVGAPLVGGAVAKTVAGIRGAVSPGANVAADLGRAIKRDEMTPDAILQATRSLQQVRPGVATVADVGGENLQGLVERIAQTPGAGRTTIVPWLTGRQQGQLNRLSVDLRDLTGTSQSATQAIAETMAERSRAAKPLYDQAMNFNARDVPEIVNAWTRETNSGFGQYIVKSPMFRRTLQTEYGISDPTNAPLMVVIDAWKKQADDMVGELARKGNNNGARVISDMRDRVLKVMDEHNPTYQQARNAWAGPSRYLDAIEEGRNVLNTKIGSEDLAAAIGAMSNVEQEAYRIGAVSSILGKMGSDTAKMPDLTKYLRSPEMRAKLAAIMPTPEARQTWQQRLDFEVALSGLTGRSLGNSATARRLAEREDAHGIVTDLVMDAFSGTPPVSLLRRAIGAVPQKIRDTLRSRSDAVLAELLTDPQSMAGLQAALARVNATQGPPSIMRNPALVTGTNAALLD